MDKLIAYFNDSEFLEDELKGKRLISGKKKAELNFFHFEF